MAFKPKNASRPQSGDYEPFNAPVPREGSRKARVSLIVELGEQEREDFKNPDGTTKPQKPCQQVAVFVDLTADTVDYGGNIGKAHYRLPVNRFFGGQYTGINFQATPPKDADGNIMEGKPWGLHPNSPLTKIAKAIGKPEIITDMDISKLLNEPFMAQVEVKRTPAKDKKDKDGNPIVYTNVNFKGAAPVPNQEDEDGNDIGPIPVPALKVEPRCIQFETATKEDIQFIRAGLRKQIKLALDYPGSQMQKAIEAWEAEQGEAGDDDAGQEEEKPKAVPKPAAAAKPKAQADKPKPVPVSDDDESDVPF